MSNSILVKVIMPSAVVFKANATSVNIPGGEGVFGVLRHHAKLISTIEIGSISIFTADKEDRFFIYKGIAEINGTAVNIVSEFAVSLDEQTKPEVIDKIAKLKSELELTEKDSLEAEILNSTLVKYKSLLDFITRI